MNEKYSLAKFSASDTKEHEGITYKAVRQEREERCKGCAFHKRGEPCKSPRGWLCVDVIEGKPNDLIFKIVE
ncbi:hypothetical protein BC669P3_00027 [Bacteroides phage BC669P3]|nr:hypothetical protein BC669P3_00027 [Bacteroides phage BC669P3]